MGRQPRLEILASPGTRGGGGSGDRAEEGRVLRTLPASAKCPPPSTAHCLRIDRTTDSSGGGKRALSAAPSRPPGHAFPELGTLVVSERRNDRCLLRSAECELGRCQYCIPCLSRLFHGDKKSSSASALRSPACGDGMKIASSSLMRWTLELTPAPPSSSLPSRAVQL